MPIIKSAQKRMRQTAKRRARNIASKRSLRGELKVLASAIEAKDVKKATQSLAKVQSELDKGVKKNLLKKNTAARKLSNLSEKVKALGAKPATAKTKKVATKSVATKATKAKTTKTPTKKPVAKKAAAKK